MDAPLALQLRFDDVLADLTHARRQGDLGRLALIAYCEVRRWARDAGEEGLAEHASQLITRSPHGSRDAFLQQIDLLIRELEQLEPEALRIRRNSGRDEPHVATAPIEQASGTQPSNA